MSIVIVQTIVRGDYSGTFKPGARQSVQEMNILFRPFQQLGQFTIRFVTYFCGLFRLIGETLKFMVTHRARFRRFAGEAARFGIGSLPVIIVTGAFTGAVFAAQMSFAFSDFGLGTTVGAVVSLSICRELGPVLTALMLVGRVGSSMAAQIGTMKVTDQIDALRCMGVSPVEFLVVPRFQGIMLATPILSAIAIICGIAASHFIAVFLFSVPSEWYGYKTWINTNLVDILIGIIKGFFFCGIIVFVSCHQGLNSGEGTEGVGKATTSAVVIASLLIIVSNLFLTLILNHFFPLQLINL